jgi:replication factor A1
MTNQEIIQKILKKNPELSPQQILEKLQAEKARNGGLLGDETLLRLIAAKFGVEVPQNTIQNNGNLSTSRLFAGLNDVTVAGRLIAISPARSFEGEKPGKFATLMVADNDGILRVVLWNDKADLVERGELKAGQALRLLHGYTRGDRYGKVELHLGGKSQIELEPEQKVGEHPTIDKFATKIGSLNSSSGTVHLSGTVKAVFGLASFARSDETDGTVMRFTLEDDSGRVTVVAWNEKARELEKTLKANSRLQLLNARVKEAQNSGVEVHVDSNTCINVQINVQNDELQLTQIAALTENQSVNVQGVVFTVPQSKEVTTSKGEVIKLLVFELKDDSGAVRVSAWRQHAEVLNDLKMGDKLLLENASVKKGFGNKMELSTRSGTVISVKP